MTDQINELHTALAEKDSEIVRLREQVARIEFAAEALERIVNTQQARDREKDAKIAELQRLLSIERDTLGQIRLALLNDPHGNAEEARRIADQSREERTDAYLSDLEELRKQVATLTTQVEDLFEKLLEP